MQIKPDPRDTAGGGREVKGRTLGWKWWKKPCGEGGKKEKESSAVSVIEAGQQSGKRRGGGGSV